ncbi:MAG: glycosyltransferase [Thermodesulfobacteriota bacterium]
MIFLSLGSRYFDQALIDLGHEVLNLPDFGTDPDLPQVLARLPVRPDVVLLTDDLGRRVLPNGLEEIEPLKVWYGVDGPINLFWHRHYAGLFDLVLADQKDCADKLDALTPAGAHWLPVAVDTSLYTGPPEEKVCDIAFVGQVSEKVRPKRFRILERLSGRYSVRLAGTRPGEWVPPQEASRLYRQARLVLNENLFDGVTTRMFEAMASGGLLLTEAVENGLTDLFQPGQDLAWYNPDNLLDQVDYYLDHPRERERIAARGREKVWTGHDIRHRAERMLELIEGAMRPASTGVRVKPGEEGLALFWAGLRWPNHDGWARLSRAERLLSEARRSGQAGPETLFCLGVTARLKNEPSRAKRLLTEAAEAGSIPARLGLGLLAIEGGSPVEAKANPRLAAEAAGLETSPGFQPGADADSHFWFGQILERSGHDLTPGFSRTGQDVLVWNALEHYQRAAALNPGHVLSLVGLARILISRRAFTEAHPILVRAAELEPHSMELARMADEAARKGYIAEDRWSKVA